MSKKTYLYAARNTTTGKLVSNLTNPRRKYWDRENNARNAINRHNRYYKGTPLTVELVKFELVEVSLDNSTVE